MRRGDLLCASGGWFYKRTKFDLSDLSFSARPNHIILHLHLHCTSKYALQTCALHHCQCHVAALHICTGKGDANWRRPHSHTHPKMLTAQRQQLASSSCLRHNRHQLQQHTRQHRRRSTVVVASAYTQPACAAIRNAQQEACRQASMFLAPPHLLQVSTRHDAMFTLSLLLPAPTHSC